MRLLKLLLGALTLPLCALLGLGFFLPHDWYVERALAFDVPPQAVVAYVADLRHWAEFSPWANASEGVQVSFAGPPSGAGAALSFQGGGVREGTLTLTSVDPARGIAFTLSGGAWGKDSKGFISVLPLGGRTRVSFGAEGKLRSYLGRYLQPVLQLNVGGELEQALLGLKGKLQSPSAHGPAVAGPTVAPAEPGTASIADDVEQPHGVKPAPIPAAEKPAPEPEQPVAEKPAPPESEKPAPPEPEKPPEPEAPEPEKPAPTAADGEQAPP